MLPAFLSYLLKYSIASFLLSLFYLLLLVLLADTLAERKFFITRMKLQTLLHELLLACV
jgi:hypothetical protein